VLITLDENRNIVRKLIDTKTPTIKYRIPDFGYLAWFDVSSLGLGSDPAAQILERSKLALNAGVLYGPKHSNFVRFNFGTSEEIINQAFERLIKVL
jgi:cystathionine beta-lyase